MDLLKASEQTLEELTVPRDPELELLQDSPVVEELAESPEFLSFKFNSAT